MTCEGILKARDLAHTEAANNMSANVNESSGSAPCTRGCGAEALCTLKRKPKPHSGFDAHQRDRNFHYCYQNDLQTYRHTRRK